MVLWFVENDIENRSKYFPVDVLLQFHQRIFELGETFELELFIKKFRQVGIDSFQGSRVRMMETAVRYGFLGFL